MPYSFPASHGGGGVPLRRQFLIPDALIVDEHIGHVPQHHHQQRQHHSQYDLPSFFSTMLPPRFTNLDKSIIIEIFPFGKRYDA